MCWSVTTSNDFKKKKERKESHFERGQSEIEKPAPNMTDLSAPKCPQAIQPSEVQNVFSLKNMCL